MLMGNRYIQLSRFLKSTTVINSDSDIIKATAESLFNNANSDEEIVKRLFYFIRDEIRYIFRLTDNPEDLKASFILQRKQGFCTQKAILFCAIARSINIPAGIAFFEIIDYFMNKSAVNGRLIQYHGIASLYLHGRWILFDATLDKRLCEMNNRPVTEFSATKDCLMPPLAENRNKHIEYVKFRGMCSNIVPQPFIRLMQHTYSDTLFR